MAHRFRFRLETIRRLREQARDAQRRAVADAVRTVRAAEERIAQLKRQLHGTVEKSRDAQQTGPLDMVALRSAQFYRGWLHRKIAEAGVELTETRAGLDAERTRLAEASKRLKVVERLRERQWAGHRVELAREEQAAGDEAALHMHLRRRSRDELEVQV